MEHEFNDRISAQRKILRVINRDTWAAEDLFGLSSKAINRWVTVNRIDPNSLLVSMVNDVSAKLFFLASKSQDQVSDQYRFIRAEIIAACDEIGDEIQNISSSN